MNKQDLLPSQVVVDLVLQYSAAMPIAGQAAVLKGSLLIAAKNHLGQFVSFGMPAHFDGDPFDGDAATPPRFVLRKIGATVWKLAPSIKHDLLHAFITIVDVPPAVAWMPVTDAQILKPQVLDRLKELERLLGEACGELEDTGGAFAIEQALRILKEAGIDE